MVGGLSILTGNTVVTGNARIGTVFYGFVGAGVAAGTSQGTSRSTTVGEVTVAPPYSWHN